MDELRQISEPKEYLQQARKIFEERELEFQMREITFKKKNASLQNLLDEIDEKRKIVENQKEDIESQRILLVEEQKQVADLEMQYNLELEKVCNEKMKLKRMTMDYEQKIQALESDSPRETSKESVSEDLTDYIHVSEHEQIVATLNEEKMQLQSEKTDFMKRILELDAQLKLQKEMDISESIITGDAAQKMQEDTNKEDEDIQEELTAEVLKKYLDKNDSSFENMSVRHSVSGDQLYAERGGLQYQVLFSRPAYFDITATRRNSPRLRNMLSELNNQYPEVQFRYEDEETKVYATGYFTNDIKPYELMQRIKRISDCFSM